MSARISSSSGPGPSTSSLPPVTPHKKYKRKSIAPLSTKQYDRMAKQLLAVQQATREEGASLVEEDEERGMGEAAGAAEVLSRLDINAQTESDAERGSTDGIHRTAVSSSSHRLVDGQHVRDTQTTVTTDATSHWLRKVKGVGGLNAPGGLTKKPGQGPDGLRLAMAAAKGLQGRTDAPNDSFAHEGSFLFNPLGRRVPRQTPRKSTNRPPLQQAANEEEEVHEAGVNGEPGQGLQDAPSTDNKIDLAQMPREVQEAAIIEDLLFVLMGIEGQYITFAAGYDPEDVACQLRGATYTIDDSLDPSLRDLVLRILPLATCYGAISTFVDMDSMLHFGTVTHALCAAIRDILKEYETLIVQLEQQLSTSPFFTLQKVWLFIHPTLHRLSLVYALVSDIAAITHADVLESDSEDGDSDDDESEGGEAMREAREEMERERKKLFQLDGTDQEADEDTIVGGIVKGGETLSMLWDRIEKQSGDPRAHELFCDLFNKASQPYAKILLTWISTGVLTDSYDEFMVFEDHRVTYDSLKTDPSDIYWEQRYTLRDQNILAAKERDRQMLEEEEYQRKLEEDQEALTGRGLFTGGAKIPSFLEAWKSKILLAGKYLNVVRECAASKGGAVEVDQSEVGLTASEKAGSLIIMTDDSFFRRIEEAYQRANIQLLHLLVDEYSLVDRLRSLKHYFFFSSSDFFSSYVEQAERELRKVVNPMHVRDSVKTRLQTHLGMVLGSSAVVGFSDPYREDVTVGTALDNPYESLKRIANTKGVKADAAEAIALKAKMKARERDHSAVLLDLLEFDVTVKFPVSLVISRKNMIRWKFVHTILIQLKVTERQLADVWLEQQSKHWQTRVTDHPELEGWKMRVFKLRHRMIFFVQNLLAFYTTEIIEPNWAQLEKKMESARTVDQFLKDHTDFLNECRRECMLTDVRFVEFLGRLMSSARTFYDNRSRLDDHVLMTGSTWSSLKLESTTTNGLSSSSPPPPSPPELGSEMWRALEKQESRWSKGLKGFNSTVQLLATTDNPAALPLALRLQSA